MHPLLRSGGVIPDLDVAFPSANALPGVVARRSVLFGSAAAIAALFATGGRAQGPQGGGAAGGGGAAKPLTLDDFVARMLPQAQQVAAGDGRSEDEYLFAAAAAALRLGELPAGEFRPFPEMAGTETAPLRRTMPLVAVLVKVAPGAVIPLHDHGGTLGLIAGLEGELRVRNFTLAEPAKGVPENGPFVLRQTTDDLLEPGRVSTLGSTRDNFHEVTAGPRGALVFDLFTVVRRGVRSRFYTLAKEPLDATRRTFTAEPKG